MTAFDELVTSLVTGGMEPGAAASLVARAVIEATAKAKTSGAARTARWRERHKASQNVTGASSHSTVTVTSQASQNVTSDAARSESAPISILPLSQQGESEEEDKKESKKVRSSEPRARGTRLPDDWVPSEVDRQYAASRGLRAAEIETEAIKFRNYWTNRTDKQACKPRWDRAWQNWILNMRGTTNGQAPRDRSRDDFRNALDQLRDFGERGMGSEDGGPPVRLLPAARNG